jgi:hypothetical protein
MKPHKNIGLHPDNALKIALKLFDNKQTTDEKVKLLLNNRSIKNLESVDTPKDFGSHFPTHCNKRQRIYSENH